MWKSLFCLFFPIFICAQNHKTPEQIEQELEDAETEFKKAKEMFNPWYAGPLLTGGAHMMPPGSIGIQPYLFLTDNRATFNHHRHSVDVPDLVQFNPQTSFQAGVTSWLDASLTLQGFVNWKEHEQSGGFGDTNLSLGFPLVSEGIYMPAMKVGVAETFPTGRYRNLNSKKLSTDSTGAGSFETAFSFRIAKLTLWATQHPLNLRATFTYTIPSTVRVKGFNTYGGGFGTRGKVRPGNQFNASVGMEWSFTQKWVFANDFVYVYNGKTNFTGNPGTTATGLPATVGGPSNDNFSLAPAIEYNPTPDLNFLGGIWFSAIGRNSSNFLSGVISAAYTFSVN